MKLRDYQAWANAQTFKFLYENLDPSKNPVIAMPTGTGKAPTLCAFASEVMQTWPGQRIMSLVHVKELVEQNAATMRRLWPGAPLGIYSAGLGEKTLGMPLTFAGVQSVRSILKKDAKAFGRIDIVQIDECHLLSPDDNAAYSLILMCLREINPKLRVVGYTATPYRLGMGLITDGNVFTDFAVDMTGLAPFNWFIDEGYLSPLVPMPTHTELSVDGVGKRGGEFISKDLQEAVVKFDLTKRALEEAAVLAEARSHWLIYTTGIEHIDMCLHILGEFGISALGVHSKMSDYERDDNLARFKAGQVRALVNADILTTGFDFPALDCIVLLRPTNSPGLHVQILGRGTRPFYLDGFDLSTTEGRLESIASSPKRSCLVLDFAGNTMRLGPINDPRIPKRKGAGGGDMPLKTCPACGCLNHISARICTDPVCGHEFSFETKIETTASTAVLIAKDKEPETPLFDVDRVTYALHKKQMNFHATLKVSYFCGIRRFTEYVCLEHAGNPIQHKARQWWRQRTDIDPPDTIEEAIRLDPGKVLRVPTQIRVWVNKQYPEILQHIFEESSNA